MNYINATLNNKLLELYRNSRNYNDHKAGGDVYEEGLIRNYYIEKSYLDVMIEMNVDAIIQYLPESKKKIAALLLQDELSDIQVYDLLGLSIQYINRVRRKIMDIFLQNYLEI